MVSVQTQIDRARWWALSNQPFYGSLSCALQDVITEDVETSSTDGVEIKWNPTFIAGLTDEEVRFVLLHETLHCAQGHFWRLPLDSPGNEAGDHAINLTLKGIPGIKLPEGVLADEQYRDLAEEEILGKLRNKPKPPPKDPNGDGQGGGCGTQQKPGQGNQPGKQPGNKPSHGGHGCPCGGLSKPAVDPAKQESAQAQSEALRDKWKTRVIQAAQAQQVLGIGEIPADMQRVLDRAFHHPVDWRKEMSDFVRTAIKSTKNDWSRMARRYAWQKVVYPRKRAHDLGTVVFARDTSGSVNNKIMAQYSALITDAIAEMECAGLVIDCDTRIQKEYELEPGDECPLTAEGGGGTNFCPVFERVEELVAEGKDIAGVVYLTDMQAHRQPESSEIPTLWLATTDYNASKFGRVVRIEVV